ncbi:MAG: lipoprotein-releasing ABC transporter permease subunit [Alphaproteobacteria bacterium]|nr:MAG: lipoprotein-releasing ABC transporter permease subunit [Alphaproteobacteria bacterium]
MLNTFVPLVVRRYLGSRRGFTRVVTIFSVLGILLGVAALIIVLAVMSGFRQELMGRILGVSGHATLQVEELQAPQARELAAELEKIKGVVKATPYVSGQVMVTAEGRATGAFLRGVDGDPLANMGKTVDVVGDNLGEENKLLVGSGLASQLGLMPGSGVTLLSPEGNRTVMGFMPRTGQFGVAGTFNVGMVQFDNALVLGKLEDVQGFLGRKDGVDALEIRLEDAQEINALMPQILDVADQFADSPMDVSVVPWTVANAEFFRALQVERVTMFIILSLIVLVAAFNIITGQMMLVNDKMGDIAILRTMGATQGQIRRIFLYNGLMLGGIGVAGGIALGMLVVWRMADVVNGIKALTGIDLFPSEVYFLSELPGRINANDMLNVVGMAMVLTVLASLYPAWRASKLNPVELLRRG